MNLPSDKDENTPTIDIQSEAVAVCQGFVENRLAAPGTADFPPAVGATPILPNGWRVASYVDSENRFGANLRAFYECKIWKDSSGQWELIDLQIHER